jgi:site-specific DNA-methyltransferase (adenine-specific)
MTASLPLNHIICGDALRILKQLPDKSIDLVVTDPPYGDNTSYGKYHRTITGNEHPLVALAGMAECYRLLKANTSAYMFCGSRHLGFLQSFFQSYTSYAIRDVIIWDKKLRGGGYGFRRQYECILVLEKGKARYHNPNLTNILRYRRAQAVRHPHEKPVALIETLIRQSSDEGDIVLDPFLGTGTTALATLELNRHYIGIEFDPGYCRIAKARLQQVSEAARAA